MKPGRRGEVANEVHGLSDECPVTEPRVAVLPERGGRDERSGHRLSSADDLVAPLEQVRGASRPR